MTGRLDAGNLAEWQCEGGLETRPYENNRRYRLFTSLTRSVSDCLASAKSISVFSL